MEYYQLILNFLIYCHFHTIGQTGLTGNHHLRIILHPGNQFIFGSHPTSQFYFIIRNLTVFVDIYITVAEPARFTIA